MRESPLHKIKKKLYNSHMENKCSDTYIYRVTHTYVEECVTSYVEECQENY